MVSYIILLILWNLVMYLVLILVVMEDGLVLYGRIDSLEKTIRVLILVVMEDGLVLDLIRLY